MYAAIAHDGDGALKATYDAGHSVRGGLAFDDDRRTVRESWVGGRGEARCAKAHRHDAHGLRELRVIEVAGELRTHRKSATQRKKGTKLRRTLCAMRSR